jgi:ribokinase
MPSIVTIGSSNVDLIMKMARLPQVGETVTDAVFMQTMGGKGANQAYAAARANGAVSFVSCVGDDAYGAQVIANMQSAGVNTAQVYCEAGVATGTALIMIGEAGHNYLSVAPGANYRLDESHLLRARDVIAGSDLVMLQYEIKPDTLAKSIMLAAELGKKVMFNLAPARPLDERLIAHINYLVVNETEAAFLTGQPVDSPAKVHAAARTLLSKGAQHVIITLGAQGVYAAAAEGDIEIAGFEVDAIDTTAAGDTFCGALATALLEGMPMGDALRFANAAAAISVTRMGAQASVPDRAEIDAFLRVRSNRPSFA